MTTADLIFPNRDLGTFVPMNRDSSFVIRTLPATQNIGVAAAL